MEDNEGQFVCDDQLLDKIDLSVSCPICNKRFPQEEIESHADSCAGEFFSEKNSLSPILNSKQSKKVQKSLMFETESSFNKHSKSNLFKQSSKTDESNHNNMSPKAKRAKSNIFQPVTKRSKLEQESGESTSKTDLFNILDFSSTPLAELMRPTTLEDYVGQSHLLKEKSMLRSLLENSQVPSMILWGPPGCGKTTLAHVIAQRCRNAPQNSSRVYRFVKLSAVNSGVADVKKVVEQAKNDLLKRTTIVFIDEIHRFNKTQQDSLLPSVESGLIRLIGATTQNPSFSINSALLSRCRVMALESLTPENVKLILLRAVEKYNLKVESAAISWLSLICDGDVRIALNALQMALTSLSNEEIDRNTIITVERVKEGFQKSHINYDRTGDQHYFHASALQKSIRGGDPSSSLYWVTRMLHGGEDPMFIARRLVRTAAEDIGLGDPQALPLAVAAMQGCQQLGMPECDVLLGQTAVYLARANHDPQVYLAMRMIKDNLQNDENHLPQVPLHLRNASTRLMKDLGYGKGYNHDPKKMAHLSFMPEGMEQVDFLKMARNQLENGALDNC